MKKYRPEILMSILLVLITVFYLSMPDIKEIKKKAFLEGEKTGAETLITGCVFVRESDENWRDLVDDVLNIKKRGRYKNIVFSRREITGL